MPLSVHTESAASKESNVATPDTAASNLQATSGAEAAKHADCSHSTTPSPARKNSTSRRGNCSASGPLRKSARLQSSSSSSSRERVETPDMFADTPTTPLSNTGAIRKTKVNSKTPRSRRGNKDVEVHRSHKLTEGEKVYLKLKDSDKWGMFKVEAKREIKNVLDAKTQPVVLKNVLTPTQVVKVDLKKGGHTWTTSEAQFEQWKAEEAFVDINNEEPVPLEAKTLSELENLQALAMLSDEALAEVEMSGTAGAVDNSSSNNVFITGESEPNVYCIQHGEQNIVFATTVPRDQWHLGHVKQAKQAEMSNLAKFETYEEIEESLLSELQASNVIRSLWVIVSKDLMGETVTKARLVCRGNEETVDIQTSSPTASRLSLRLLLSTAATKNWKISSLDFTGAFLQGRVLDREVIMVPPPDQMKYSPRGERILWRLRKRLYGLRDASRGFWLEVDDFLLSQGCQRSKHDKATYLLKDHQGNLLGVCCVHVDDLLFAGEKVFHDQIIQKLVQKFVVGRIESELFTFTGWRLHQQDGKISLSQDPYIEKLSAKDVELLNLAGQPADLQLPEAGQKAFRSIVGALAWLSGITRPDLCRVQTELASRQGKATARDANLAYKIVKKFATVPQTVQFVGLGNIKDCKIKTYADAAQGRKDNTESVKGSIIWLQNSVTGNANPLDWSTQVLRPPAISSLAAEAAALNEAYGRSDVARDVIRDFYGLDKLEDTQLEMVMDCRSLYQAIQSDGVIKDRRSAVAVATLRDIQPEANTVFTWVPGKLNLADHMTKSGTAAQHLTNILSGRERLPLGNHAGC